MVEKDINYLSIASHVDVEHLGMEIHRQPAVHAGKL
jgi:hypothetical protein